MTSSVGKTALLQPNGAAFTVSPANCDVSFHIDEKAVRLAALGFSAVSRSSLNLSSCLFLGNVASAQSTSVLDVYADRYDSGQGAKRNAANDSLFPTSSVCTGPDDVVIPCFLNRRISKAELKQLSMTTLFPSIEDRGFAPSLRDVIACCISLQLSATNDSPRSSSPMVVTRADLRISLPTNTATFTPVTLPGQLFGGISVSDLLPPVISAQGRQIFRAGYISLRTASNRLASSLGFLLDGDVWKQTNPSDASLLGIWVSGCNGSPEDDLRVYAACMRYAYDNQLAKCRVLPSLSISQRISQPLPFMSTQSTPYFLVAVVKNVHRQPQSVTFYECRLSPALQPSFTILTATTLLPPPPATGERLQMLKLNFILGRAASVAVGSSDRRESIDDSTDDPAEDDDATDYLSEPPSALSSFRRKPLQPQPQPSFSRPMPSVPDVSVWVPASQSGSQSQTRQENSTPRQATTFSTPRLSGGVPIPELQLSTGKSATASVSDFEDEWRAMRQKVDAMWVNSAHPPKLSSTMISESTSAEASVAASPQQVLRTSTLTTKTKITDVSDGNVSARTLRDACVGVGTSLLMLNSPKSPAIAQRVTSAVSTRDIEQTINALSDSKSKLNNLVPASSNVCSQCCSREDLASVISKSEVAAGCCLFPRRQKPSKSEANYAVKEQLKLAKQSDSFIHDEKDAQYDPCSLILKWLQRCGNEPATSSVCGDAVGPDTHSRCSSNDENVKTAAAICTYLNGDSTIRKSRIDEAEDSDDDNDDNQFVSLSASSASMILKPRDRDEKVTAKQAESARSISSCWTNGVHASMVSEKAAENGDSFAARAREIVRQMDEWGLAPTHIRSEQSSVDTSMPNDVSHIVGYSQVKTIGGMDRLNDVSLTSSSHDSASSRSSTGNKRSTGNNSRNSTNPHSSADVNVSVALPRVVALESLRLGPTNTTLVMKSLASKHLLTSTVKEANSYVEDPSYQKPPPVAANNSRR